ncbi:hypothetical protein G6L37_00250 [Agrobacterium rubi]|nr:hypothetical protein [Agrobacterium rubi]NTF23681.1 hypothetical protein [Agrobacterium rubi]
MTATTAAFTPIAAIMGHHSLPDVGQYQLVSPSKGALHFDVSADGEEMKIEVFSPYFLGSCLFRARSAGKMLEVRQDNSEWRAFRSIADFIEQPDGIRMSFFSLGVRRQGASDYDARN